MMKYEYSVCFSAVTLFTVEVNEACDFFINTDYCQNNGECVIASGEPECRLVK